jgi:AAA ATPase-like protein
MAGALIRKIESRHSDSVRFLDRHIEARLLRSALEARQSFLISGPEGIGKTALVTEVLSSLPERQRRRMICLSGVEAARPLLESLLMELHARRDATLLAQTKRERSTRDPFRSWLSAHATSRLKGSAYRALEAAQYAVVIDHSRYVTPASAKVIKELADMRNTPVVFVSRGDSKKDLGSLEALFWHPERRIKLGPLGQADARRLFDLTFQPGGDGHAPDFEAFRADVLGLSRGVPGAIIAMAAMAANPRYRAGERLKTRLMRIDYLLGRRDPKLPVGGANGTR